VAKQFFWHRFFSHQPDLNFDNPAVLEAVFRVMRFWLDMGVDGFRLDAIPYLIERDGTSNENLPQTHDVIKQVRAAIDANYQNRFLLAEANMWPEDVREYFGEGDECHMAYHFPLMPRMYMAIAQEDRDPIVEILQQTPDIPEGCQWAIFLRNHDELTLEMVTNRERDNMYTTYAADLQARINLGIRRRLAPLMENDKDAIRLMNGMLLSMPGSPIIYYGDELGMGDNVFVGDRNGVRTPMQWSPDRNAGFSRADPQRLYLQPIMDPIHGYEAINVEAQLRDKSSLLQWTRRMLAVRKTSRAFGRGQRTFLRPGNRKILAYISEHDGDVILSVFNLSRAAQPVELDLAAWKGRVPVEMMGRTSFPPIGELPYLLTLPSRGFYWFRLAEEAPLPTWHQESVGLRDRPVLVLFDGWTSLFRDQVMPWRIGFADRLRDQFERDTLPPHMQVQRWYATKGSIITRASVRDSAIFEADGRQWMLPLLDLQGPPEASTYFMPLAIAWEEQEEERTKALERAAIAKIRQQANVGLMGDAMFDEPFCRAVVSAIVRGHSVAATHGTVQFRATRRGQALDAAAAAALPVSAPTALSSNTVVMLDETLFLKAYRQIRPGVNPELEMGRFLTEVAGYPNSVPVLGAIEYESADGSTSTLALLQAYVPNQGDGWNYTLDYLERYLSELRSNDGAPRAEEHGAFLALVQILGQRTAELHNALAMRTGDPAFDPEPMAEGELDALRDAVREDARTTLAQLQAGAARLPDAAREDVRRLLAHAPQIDAALARLSLADGPLLRTRYHGDYHLGQVLVARNDFFIIDFEGEPARPLEERRAKHCALRDVAGMLRSFDYARWSALRRAAQNADELVRLGAAAARWESHVAAAFLGGYGAALSPELGQVNRRLLGLLQLEKALYELRYEINNRPDWVTVPLQGILALADRAAAAGMA